jgi:hypothetical protein
MALIRKTGLRRNFAKDQVRPDYQFISALNPPIHDISMGRRALRASERPNEMMRRQARDLRECLHINVLLQVSVDICCDAPNDTGRQATSSEVKGGTLPYRCLSGRWRAAVQHVSYTR